MAGIDLPKQTTIYKADQPLTALHLITSGHVLVQYPGGEFRLGKGDVIGLCEIASEMHFLDYTAIDDINMLTYPYNGINTLMDLLQKHPDLTKIFLLSAFRQITLLLHHCNESAVEVNNLFSGLMQHYQTYREICTRYHTPVRTLPSFDILDTSFFAEAPDLWLFNYYIGLLHTFSSPDSSGFRFDATIAYGFLYKASEDFQKNYQSMSEHHLHKKQLLQFYMNDTSQDLFAYLSTLYHQVARKSTESKSLYEILEYIIALFQNDVSPAMRLYKQRISGFRNSVINLYSASASASDSNDAAVIYARLHNSLAAILAYTGVDNETVAACQKTMNAYKALPNRADDTVEAEQLRAELTTHFYSLYSIAAIKNLEKNDAPLPVRLFLNFGYMDEELAGADNCLLLTGFLQNHTYIEHSGVYTFYEWLNAIYTGKKEPSRNEFSEDYSYFIHKQKISGTLSEADVRALENNTLSKVIFELRNVFPMTNKFSCGRLSGFCPIFSAENILKPLDSSYVNTSTVEQALSRIRAIDFSLFYREILNYDSKSVYKEALHIEQLPDIILLPNIGIRGVMWQEIEGKRRNTPCRMMLSIFHMEDISATLVRLCGEYRWEMCKRIQGYRWNDISTRSLTSEYFDYIQFYKKNRNLSNEAKDRIKSNLLRLHSSFKEMFVRDYIIWILFESTGSQRLNKVSREILFNYCPFSASIRDTLSQNPQYGELLQRYELKRAQKLHHLNQICKKLLFSNTPIPAEVEAEINYYNQ